MQLKIDWIYPIPSQWNEVTPENIKTGDNSFSQISGPDHIVKIF